MATNRLTRDQAINRALDLIDSPRLDERCRGGITGPSATITPDPNIATTWYQEGVDLAHILCPMQAQITTTSVNLTAGTETYALPSDYIQDFNNGLLIADASSGQLLVRASHRSLDRLLNVPTHSSNRGLPRLYTIVNNLLWVRQVPDKSYTGTLYYYKLPGTVAAGSVPTFPTDFHVVRYLFLCGKEWLREEKLGAAEMYLRAALSSYQKAGIQQEGENDQITVDREYFPGGPSDPLDVSRDSWMGPTTG